MKFTLLANFSASLPVLPIRFVKTKANKTNLIKIILFRDDEFYQNFVILSHLVKKRNNSFVYCMFSNMLLYPTVQIHNSCRGLSQSQ